MARRLPAKSLFAVTISLAGMACSGSSGSPQGPGGHRGSGGAAGSNSGGSGGSGGGGSGGAPSAGGSSGAGGVGVGSGGQTGTGGAKTDAGMDGTATSNPDAGRDGGGGGRVDAGSSGGGASGYNPCPTNGDPCKILPLGDSITHGFASTDDGGYRSQLFKLIVAANQKVTFTGSLANGPTQVSGQTFPRMHEGHDGWTIDPGFSTFGSGGISSLIPSPALNGNPHIILLHIGTNDTGFMDSANMSTRLEALLDKIAQASPQRADRARPDHAARVHERPAHGVQRQDPWDRPVTRRERTAHRRCRHEQDARARRHLHRHVHPNDQGYVYMANIWYAAIKNLLPQ